MGLRARGSRTLPNSGRDRGSQVTPTKVWRRQGRTNSILQKAATADSFDPADLCNNIGPSCRRADGGYRITAIGRTPKRNTTTQSSIIVSAARRSPGFRRRNRVRAALMSLTVPVSEASCSATVVGWSEPHMKVSAVAKRPMAARSIALSSIGGSSIQFVAGDRIEVVPARQRTSGDAP